MSDDSTRSIAGASAAPDRQLFPGDLLAGRFTIIRFVARGGMGEVYEATDQYFQNRSFALKTLRGEVADNLQIRQRFEREVLLAREVRHDNVCPTYDLFHVEGPRGPITFLTMKLLVGESLATRLAQRGPFDVESALPIVRQMASALDAAHRAGVIHRDFKPGNVMLEPSTMGEQVLITDFGLSRSQEANTSLAETGHVPGTLGYIAPEILHGEIAKPASDVYSFGVTVYEMLTGRRPVYNSGRQAFLPPSAISNEVPNKWDRMVLGCLENDPARRFQTAGEALAVLAPRTSSLPSIARRMPPHLSRRRVLAAAIVTVLLVVAGWLFRLRVYDALHPLPEQRFVALMAWPADPDQNHRSLLRSALDAIAARLGRAEAQSKNLLIISPADVAGQAPPKGPADVVGALGANLALTATLQSQAARYILRLKVLDAATGRALRAAVIGFAANEPAKLLEMATAEAADLLSVQLKGAPLTDNQELLRATPNAFQAYGAAEESMAQPNDSGLDQAIEEYQKALDADPRFALAYARLSMAYTRKFYRTQDPAALALASKNAEQALHFNPDSGKAAMSRAMADLYSGETQQALEGMGHAMRLDPGNPQILLYKAVAFRFLDRRAEEEEVYREIIRERPNFWPAYNELGGVLHRHGNDKEAAEAFAEASAIAPRAALPLTNLGAIYMLMNRKADAAEAFRRSLERAPTELAYLQMGNLSFGAGDYPKALDYYGKARDLRPRNDITWRNIGDCYAMLKEPAKVRESYQTAAQLLGESLRTNPLRGSAWMTLAFYQAKLGRRTDAAKALAEAETRGATDLHSQFVKAQALALLGRKEDALRLILECMDKGLTSVEVDLALDLADVRSDPRYRRRAAAEHSGH